MFNEITTQVEVTARTKIPIEITSSEAFRILCKTFLGDTHEVFIYELEE